MTRSGTHTSPTGHTATLPEPAQAPLTPSAPGVEPKPAGTPEAQAIFVSPRVVDRLAFDEYAAILRKLVGDAAAQRDLLKSAAEQARASESSVGALGKQLHTRVEQAARALPLLDQRLAKAEQLLSLPMELLAGEKAKAVEKARKELEDQLTALVEDQVRSFRQDFEAALRQRIDTLAKEAIGDASEPVIARANAAATQLELTVTEAEARVSSLVNLAESQSERAAASRTRHVEELERRLAARIAECDAELATRATSIDAAAQALDQRILAAQSAATDAQKLKPAKLDKTIERLATIRQSVGDIGEFEAMLGKAEGLAQSAAFATSQLEAIKTQADLARSALGDELLEGAAKIDAIESRLSQLLAAAQQAGSRIGEAETRLQNRMNELETRVQGAAQRVDDAGATAQAESLNKLTAARLTEADAHLGQLTEQTRKMGEWLTTIVHQAHDCGRALDQVMRDADTLASKLETLSRTPGHPTN